MRSALAIRNVAATLISQIVSWGIAFVVTLYVPRYIGAKGLGELTVVASFSTISALIANLGMTSVLVRDVARDQDAAGRLVSASLILRFVMCLVTLGLSFIATLLLRYSSEETTLIMIGVGIIYIGQISDSFQSALKGLQEIPKQNMAMLTDTFAAASMQICIVFLRLPLWVFVLVPGISGLFSSTMAYSVMKSRSIRLVIPTIEQSKYIFNASIIFLSSSLFTAIYSQSDAILLSKLSTIECVGWFGLARRLVGSTLFLPAAVASSMFPTLARLNKESPELFAETVSRIINLMLICVTPFVVVLIAAPRQVISFMHYPASFSNAAPVLAASSGATVLWYISCVTGMALMACDRERELGKATIVGAAICLPISTVCIIVAQKYFANGAIGAAVSNAITEFFIFTKYLQALPKGIIGTHTLQTAVKSIIAIVPMLVWLVFANKRYALLGAVPFGLIYPLICWKIGCLHQRDIEMFQMIISRKIRK